ncbi:hypothetical protein [Nocardia sp. NPDC050793]|uniref:hypothetical protein n=1 Tax=Nocardia sp. NPDC050793 TaxID=3155159 RepID=UPI0033CC4547
MVQPTPWQAKKPHAPQAVSAGPPLNWVTRPSSVDLRTFLTRLRSSSTPLRGHWGYLCTATGNIVVFFLMFKPWLLATHADGKVTATAFGHIRVTTTLVSLWSSNPPAVAPISGSWAIVASCAIGATVITVGANIRARSNLLTLLATGSAVAVTILVTITMIHLSSTGIAFRNMVGTGPIVDVGTQLGLIIRWASGNGTYPIPGHKTVSYNATANLTTTAFYACAISMISAVAAIAQWIRSARVSRRSSPAVASPEVVLAADAGKSLENP